MSGEKNFEPSQKKLKKANESGNIAKAAELTAFSTISYWYLLLISSTWWAHYIFNFYHKVLSEIDLFSEELLVSNFREGSILVILAILVWGIGAMLFTSFALLPQVGCRFTFSQLEIKFSFLNVVKGIQRILKGHENGKIFIGMFSEMIQLILFGSICSLIIWKQIKYHVTLSLTLDGSEPNIILLLMRESLVNCVFELTIISGVYSIFRYSLNKKRLKKELMMDIEELKKEFKDDEGDSLVKGQRKSLHHEILAHEMIENVKNAKVLVVSD